MKSVFDIDLTQTSVNDRNNQVGSIRISGSKTYRLVQNKTGGALAAGDCVSYSPGDDATMTKVYKGATANLGHFAGVVVAAAVATNEYFWIQTRGLSTTAKVLGHASLAVGGNLIPVNSQLYLTYNNALGTAPIYRAGTVANAANTSTGSAQATVSTIIGLI